MEVKEIFNYHEPISLKGLDQRNVQDSHSAILDLLFETHRRELFGCIE